MQSQHIDALPAAATERHPGGALRKVLCAGAALVAAALLLLGVGLVATLSVIAVITQKARKVLGRKVEVNRG